MLRPPPFPISIDGLTTEILGTALDRPVAGFRATRIGADRGMLGDVHLVELEYGPDAGPQPGPPRVVAKFAALREGSLASARRGGTHERELRCYDELLRATPVAAPELHAAWYDPDTAHFLLVQEAVEADESVDQIDGLDLDRVRLVLAEVAALHARWWGDLTLADARWLPALDAEQRRTNLTTLATAGWEPLCQLLGDELTDAERALGAELPARIDEMLTTTARLPSTLLHGDLRTDNLLFSPDGRAVSLVDWQGAGFGPAGFDLAYLLTQCLTVEDRRANEADLLAFYRARLAFYRGRLAGTGGPSGGPGPADGPDAIVGYGPSILFGLAVACALPLISDPGEPRVKRLASTVTRRTLAALHDHDQLWEVST